MQQEKNCFCTRRFHLLSDFFETGGPQNSTCCVAVQHRNLNKSKAIGEMAVRLVIGDHNSLRRGQRTELLGLPCLKGLEYSYSLSCSLLQSRTITVPQKRCQRTGDNPNHPSRIDWIVPNVGVAAAIRRQGDFTRSHNHSW